MKGFSLNQLWTKSQGSGLYFHSYTDFRSVQLLTVQAGISERKVFSQVVIYGLMVLVVSDTRKIYF